MYRVCGAVIGGNFTPIGEYSSTVKNRRKWVMVFRRVGAKGLIGVWISCCRTAVGVGQRALSLSAHMAGDPPPHSWPRGGWRHHASSSEYSRYYWDVAAAWNGWFLTIWERASTLSYTLEVLVAGALSAAAFASGVGGMDYGAWRRHRTCMSPPLNTSQRGYANTEGDIGYAL